jgi:hypothetical protein
VVSNESAPARVNAGGHDAKECALTQDDPIPYGYCHCGCGQKTNPAPFSSARFGWVNQEPVRFVQGHHARAMGLRPPVNHGAKNVNFNGGLSTSEGRWTIRCRDGTKILYARAVMSAHLKRLLASSEIVHHEDEDPTNDELSNLTIVTRAEHARIHAARRRRRKALGS